MAGLYNNYILPRVTDFLCSSKPAMIQRKKILPFASGKIVEIGIGSGLNLPLYDGQQVENIIGVDSSESMLQLAEKHISNSNFPVQLVNASAENIPVVSDFADTIVTTYTLCSISDIPSVFEEIRRILKPGGKFIFCEHGLAPDRNVQKWQNRLNPMWRKFGGGCNLNRNIPELIRQCSFDISSLNSMYIPGPRIASYNYWGIAKYS